ncbi:fumarylacetoacetate FAA hydrolase family protein [Asticcacaulis biprosthecium C19]|uniref:Fumarylacetoacetate FAA hydrolase family protein n=1 Tax=Asticcacaulis biprosthecium C19 TaxID=715226 RepID=F4QI22_9CAUL|nr:AraD1 family protein [Asticcacaulis biprosthecium]EGF92889.1 fumarylacetoacetate FAA hydrolase family protein [Asticcacaulis biprosthecium C19]
MTLRLIQIVSASGERQLVAATEDGAHLVNGVSTTYELAKAAISTGAALAAQVEKQGLGDAVDVAVALSEGRVLCPIDHPDASHLHVTGTGLTHLGSAEGRDKMHKAAAQAEVQTDSMRMFLMGVKNGKPAAGETGVQPEWFYKGNGNTLVGPNAPLTSPSFAEDGGEEPEMAGIYVIGDDGTPYRIGWAIANEFSDHVVEKQNYLWLAHSKLRPASLGVEILVGELPKDVRGTSRIWRGNEVIWEKPFISGEDNMSHSFDNLEHHHFKYELFRTPGDIHVHCFGTATASFADGVKTQDGDVFEITADAFLYGLKNPLQTEVERKVTVTAL